VLDGAKALVRETRPSKSHPLTDAEVTGLLKEVETVLIAKGKKVVEAKAAETKVDDLRGPTGNIRAPLVRVGKKLLVGFNPEALRGLVGI
jgi:arsenate reductase-like glutaredoxin family protein